MRTVPLLCVFASIVFAQPASLIEATAAVNPNGSGASIVVRNRHTSPLTAFTFVYTLRTPDSTVLSASNGFYDSLIDPANKPVAPGEEIRIPYYAGNRGMIPVISIQAALFADGMTFGNRNMVQVIFERRHYAAVTLNKLAGELKQASKLGTTREQLAIQMQTALNDERNAAGNTDLANLILNLRNQVFVDLLNARNPNDGSQQSMDSFLPAEIESLTRRRETLLAAQK
jgi:hypothetical protein